MANYKLIPTTALLLVLTLLILRVPPAHSITTGQGATLVLGQTNFMSGGSATTASGLSTPFNMAFDQSGNLWVGDFSNNRVLEYLKGSGFTTGESASVVIGQSGFGSGAPATTATGLSGPTGLAFDQAGNLWVGDLFNNRVLEYLKGSGFTTGQAASIVVGQSDFTSSGFATTATGLKGPTGLALDQAGNLWVGDLFNERVLEYLKGSGFTTGQAASVAIGQSDFTSSGAATTATGLTLPDTVAFDLSGNLWVADYGNNRVLEYLKGSGFTTGQAASVVIGQSDFVSGGSATTATGLSTPYAATLDGTGNLWVGDSGNNRILGFAGSLQGITTSTSASTSTSTTTTITTTVLTSISTATSAATTVSTSVVTSVSTTALTSITTTTATATTVSPTTITSVSGTTSTTVSTTTATTQAAGSVDLSIAGAIAVVTLIGGVIFGYLLKRRS